MNGDIPLSKVHEGYHLHENLIESFLKTSEKFFENEEYTNSILFSILAWEEMSKLLLLIEYMKNKWEDIPFNEWKKRTSDKKVHSFKLTDRTLTSKRNLQSKPKEELEKMKKVFAEHGLYIDLDDIKVKDEDDEGIQTFKKLNEVKKLIMYNHWNGKNWVTFNKITKNHERKITANILLELTKVDFFNMIKIKISGKIKDPDDFFKICLENARKLSSLNFQIDREIMRDILDRTQKAYHNSPT